MACDFGARETRQLCQRLSARLTPQGSPLPFIYEFFRHRKRKAAIAITVGVITGIALVAGLQDGQFTGTEIARDRLASRRAWRHSGRATSGTGGNPPSAITRTPPVMLHPSVMLLRAVAASSKKTFRDSLNVLDSATGARNPGTWNCNHTVVRFGGFWVLRLRAA